MEQRFTAKADIDLYARPKKTPLLSAEHLEWLGGENGLM